MLRTISLHIAQLSNAYPNDAFDYIMHISFFAMPWFYFKSGYFFKLKNRSIGDYSKKLFSKLIIPFLIFSILGFILYFPFELFSGSRSIIRILLSLPYAILMYGNGGLGNLPIWFLLSLFSALVSFATLSIFKLQKIILLFPVLSFLLFYYNIHLPLGYSNLLLGIFFIYFGFIFRKYESYHKYILYISIICFLVIEIFNYSLLDFRTNNLTKGNYLLYIICSAAGIVIMFFIAKKINYIKPLNYIGKNSIIFFVVHWPIIMFTKNMFEILNFNSESIYYIVFSTLSIIILTPLLTELINNKFSYLLGNNIPSVFSKIKNRILTYSIK